MTRAEDAVRTTEVDFEGRLPVDGYGPGGFRVAGAVHLGPLALVPEGIVAWDGLPDLAPFLERVAEFDVLLVGMGVRLGPPPEGFARRGRRSRRPERGSTSWPRRRRAGPTTCSSPRGGGSRRR